MSELDAAWTLSVARHLQQQLPATRLRGLPQLSGTAVSPTPLEIYDVNGERLFHDFFLIENDAVLGVIRCAANRKLGVQVVSISHAPPRWNASAGLRLAREALNALHPQATILESRLVCYAYPKIGIELTFSSENKKQKRIFDASSSGLVAESTEQSHQFTSFSLLGSLSEEQQRGNIESFEKAEHELSAVFKGQRPDASGLGAASGLSPAQTAKFLPSWTLLGHRQGLVLQSPYCPNSPPGNSHYAQITDYFCVDASAQMLLEHYGFNYTQNAIASAMGTAASLGGTTQAGLTSGFVTLTNNDLVLSFDNGASRAQQFQDAMTEIDANRPLFTQVPHHYRVCMGYSENAGILAILFGLDQMLYIYDPWPWNPNQCEPGAPYWESWASSPVMWFGIVHHG